MNQLRVPPLFCPFPSAINPHANQIQQGTTIWAERFGLLPTERSRQRFAGAKFGWLAARAYPNAQPEELQIVSDWNTWLFMLDDQCDETGLGAQPEQLGDLFAGFLRLLRSEGIAAPLDGLHACLNDVWMRLRRTSHPSWRERFVRNVSAYFDACRWEATNRAQRRTPDVADYIMMRPLSGGLNTDVDLIDITERIDLPEQIREHETIRRLTLMTNNVVCWSNDIFSLEKELRRGDVHNLVLVLRHTHQLTLQEAIERAAEMHDAEVRAFLALAEALPPVDYSVAPDLQRYIAVLRSWMRGNLDWSLDTGRYRPSTTP